MLIASTLTLLLFAAAPQGGTPAADGAAAATSRLQEHLALVDEYQSAFLAWKKEIRTRRRAKDESWRELRDQPPALTFWPRFEALAQAGEGRALLWMARQADEAHRARSVAAETKRALYERLIEAHASEEWMAEAVVGLTKEGRLLGDAGVRALLERTVERAGAHPEVAARALVVLAGELDGRKASEQEQRRAEALYVRASEEYPRTVAGREAEQTVFELRHLRPGKPAPDFTAVDADGAEFRLSDYEGKVVLIDFWGFW